MNSTESAKHPQKRMAPRFKGSDATGEGREVEDEQRVFKKTEQVIGRPPVTDNINDQYMRDPPNVSMRVGFCCSLRVDRSCRTSLGSQTLIGKLEV